MINNDKNNLVENQVEDIVINENSNNKSESQNHSGIKKVTDKLFKNKKMIVIFGLMIVLLITVVLILVFANDKSSYYGTWDIQSVNMEGSVFTISELETIGDYSLSDFRIVIKEGGKAWIHSQGSGTTLDWEKTSNGIKIGVRECSYENELLSIENNGVIIYLSKTSNSQTIIKPETNNTHTHIGGIATCIEKAVCSACNKQYGKLNFANHYSTDFSYNVNSNDNTKHDKKYSCCGVVVATVSHSGGTATTTQKAKCEYCNASYGNILSSFNWQSAGNGCGARIPEPSFEYDVKASSTYLCVEVYNTIEEDFYDYVDECRAYGFNGTIGSATSPDLYYMVYDADEYYLEVFYYADEEYIYVYIRPPYNDSDDDNGNNDNNNDEITAEELLLAKTIAEDYNLSALETKESLISNGISEERAARIVEICDVKWHKQASHRAENFALIYATVSPDMMADLLHECGFTDEELNYAVRNCGIDWKWYAVIHADEYMLINEDNYYISPLSLKTYLAESKCYTLEDCEYAVENCNANWNNQAYLYLKYYAEECCVSTPNQDECLLQLKLCGFDDDAINYAIENYYMADNNFSEGIEYTLSNDQTYYIVSGIGTCDDENIVIASEYNHLPVREIGSSAFYNCKEITKINIPNTVNKIRDNAFRYCTNLTEVLLGDNVISIEEYAFYSCNSLLSVVLPDSVENVNDNAFAYCSSLSSITVGANIKSIGDNAFAGCFYLVEIINNSPLHFSKGLTSNGQIAYRAIEIHNKSTKISVVGNYIFYESESHDYLIGYIGDDESLVLPKNFKGNSYIINDYAFYDRYEITEVVLSDCTLEIGDYAFECCYNLAQISIPENVNKIGNRAFAECNLIIDKENGVSYVGNWAIGFDQSADKVVFRTNTVGIADAAFSQCNNIIKVELTDQIKTIGDHAFYSCDKLTDVVMSDSVLYIGRYAFSGCEKLQNIQLSRNLISIGELAFHYCKNISTIRIPLSTLVIEENAFYNCPKLSILCEANLKPSDWSDNWNPHSRPVVWGCSSN